MKQTRITFDYDNEPRKSYEKLAQIICSSHWGSGIDVFGFINENHPLIFDLMMKGTIVIDECEYEAQESFADSKTTEMMKAMLGKRSNHPVLRDMAALLGDEPHEASKQFRNTLYFPSLKAFARADGINPEHITEMFLQGECEKIILFPYFPLDDKTAYYELTLSVTKENFTEFMNQVAERKIEEMHEAIKEATGQNTAGYKAILRPEKKSDRDTVECITYRAFLNADHADGDEALLVRKMRSCAAFVPELAYVAELGGAVIGNIMYTKSKIVSKETEWETLTFGPVSVLPKYQRDGVGSALICKTLEVARELGYRAVLIFGHESYYPRFGFKPASEYGITTAEGENFPAFMALPLYDGALDSVHGRLIYDEVYSNLDKEESDKLNKKLAEPMSVDEYILAQPEHIRDDLRTIRLLLKMKMQIHDATEKMSWGMPTYWKGRNIIHFAAQKKHLGIYPGPDAVEHFKPRLGKYKTSKGAIQFPYKTLSESLSLITEIAAWCVEQIED